MDSQESEIKIKEKEKDLSYEEKGKLEVLIKDLFSQLDNAFRMGDKFNEQELNSLFSKDEAHLQFLIVGSQYLQTQKYFIVVHESKKIIFQQIIGLILKSIPQSGKMKIQKTEKCLNMLNRLMLKKNGKSHSLMEIFKHNFLWSDVSLWQELYEFLLS